MVLHLYRQVWPDRTSNVCTIQSVLPLLTLCCQLSHSLLLWMLVRDAQVRTPSWSAHVVHYEKTGTELMRGY